MTSEFFPPRPPATPKIYAYADSHPQYAGLLKVGYTARDVRERVAAQYPTLRPGPAPYNILLEENAMRNDGTVFSDHDVHRVLRARGIRNPEGEWFQCGVDEVRAAILSIQSGQVDEEHRADNFALRPEQREAVQKTAAYFRRFAQQEPGKTPHFLWNAKMRFGKTFAAYQLAREMGWKKVLVLTFKPAVQSAWESDLNSHVDFAGWQFIKPGGLTYEAADKTRPFVCFGSFQDYLGATAVRAASKPKMNGCTPQIGIVSSSMNITTAPGVSVPKICSRAKKPTKSSLRRGKAVNS